MSIPIFFDPYCVRGVYQEEDLWRGVGYGGKPPDRVLFVDGGVMSNFPIYAFHRTDGEDPTRPTFGAKLGLEREAPQHPEGIISFGKAVFDAARHALDYDFVYRHPDYKHLITNIPTKPHNWLNFSLGPEGQLDLFRKGATAAARFLKKFRWDKYKAARMTVGSNVVSGVHERRRL